MKMRRSWSEENAFLRSFAERLCGSRSPLAGLPVQRSSLIAQVSNVESLFMCSFTLATLIAA
jgi:hypothetical protein